MADHVRTSIRIPTKLHKAGVARAQAEHRDFSGHVAYLLERDLAGTTPLDHAALIAAAELAADEHARRRNKAKRPLPQP